MHLHHGQKYYINAIATGAAKYPLGSDSWRMLPFVDVSFTSSQKSIGPLGLTSGEARFLSESLMTGWGVKSCIQFKITGFDLTTQTTVQTFFSMNPIQNSIYWFNMQFSHIFGLNSIRNINNSQSKIIQNYNVRLNGPLFKKELFGGKQSLSQIIL